MATSLRSGGARGFARDARELSSSRKPPSARFERFRARPRERGFVSWDPSDPRSRMAPASLGQKCHGNVGFVRWGPSDPRSRATRRDTCVTRAETSGAPGSRAAACARRTARLTARTSPRSDAHDTVVWSARRERGERGGSGGARQHTTVAFEAWWWGEPLRRRLRGGSWRFHGGYTVEGATPYTCGTSCLSLVAVSRAERGEPSSGDGAPAPLRAVAWRVGGRVGVRLSPLLLRCASPDQKCAPRRRPRHAAVTNTDPKRTVMEVARACAARIVVMRVHPRNTIARASRDDRTHEEGRFFCDASVSVSLLSDAPLREEGLARR